MDGRKKHTVIRSVMDAIGNLRQSDYLFLDIEDTLILSGIIKTKNVVRLIENGISQQIALLRASGIVVIGLTERNHFFASTISAKLIAVNIHFDNVLYGSVNYLSSNPYLKGIILKQYISTLPSKVIMPKRIVVIDNCVGQLNSISEALSGQPVPYVLYQYVREIHYPVNVHKVKIDFPDSLDSFTEVTSLGGGTQSTFLISDPHSKQKFVIKFGVDSEAIAIEILCNAIYHALAVPVPSMHIYYQLPKSLANQLDRANCHVIFQLSEFIESKASDTEAVILQSARKHFLAHAFLGNIDVAKYENFVGETLIDAGANFMRRAKGEARKEDPSWLTELSSFRNASLNPDAHAWFSSLTPAELQAQAKHIINKSSELEHIILTLSPKINLSKPLRDKFLQIIADRMDVLISRYCIADRPVARVDKKAHPSYTAAGVLTYQLINGAPYILLSKRAKHEWWDNFGGRSHVSDQSLAVTAAREVMEESSGQLCYDPMILDSNPSHDMVSYSDIGMPFTYRMYIMPALAIDLTKLNDYEHTDYRLVPLSAILDALFKKNNRVISESKYTVSVSFKGDINPKKIESIVLYPPLFKLLQQSPVYDNLERLLLNKKMIMRHTQGSSLNSFIQKPTPIGRPIETMTQKKKYTIAVLLTQASVLQEMKRKHASVSINNKINKINTFSQSELYLKMLLKDNYKENQLYDNVAFYFFNHFYAGRELSSSEQNRLINVCCQLIYNERSTGNDYIYFYHACNDLVAFVYSVYTMLYEKLQLSPHWPVFRGNQSYGDPSVYSNVFLFGNHDRASSSSLFYFLHNITHGFFEQDKASIDLKILLSDFLKPIQIPSHIVDHLVSFYQLHGKQWGGALYQMRLPSREVDTRVVVCDYERNVKQLYNQYSLAVILPKLKQQPSLVLSQDVTTYMRYLQARITLTPKDKLSVLPIYWNLDEDKRAEKKVYDHRLSEIINEIQCYALPIILQGGYSSRYSEFPLSRLLSERYHALGIVDKETILVQHLVNAIVNRKSDDIVRILTEYPKMRDYVYVPSHHVGFIPFPVSMTVIEMIVNHYKGYSLNWLSACYENAWWTFYPVKSIDDLKLIISFILPQYDDIVLLLMQFKNIIQCASVDDLFYFASLFKRGSVLNKEVFFSAVFSSGNLLQLCFYAIDRQMTELTEKIIPYISDADLNCVDTKGRTLLYAAVQQCSLSIVSQLITMSRGNLDPNVSCSSDNDATPLHLAVINSDRLIIIALSRIPSLDPNKINRYGKSPLVVAAKRDLELMNWLLTASHLEFSRSTLFDTLCEITNESNYRYACVDEIIAAHQYMPTKRVYELDEIYIFMLQMTCEAVQTILSRLKNEFLSDRAMFIWYRSTVHILDILAVLTDSECLHIAKWNGVFDTESDVTALLHRIEAYPVQCEDVANRYQSLIQPKQSHFSSRN